MSIKKQAIATGLSLWLLTFSLLNTTHRGIPHHFVSHTDVGLCNSNCHEISHRGATIGCVWASARIATTGYLPHWNKNYIYTNPKRLPLIYTKIQMPDLFIPKNDPRAPPVLL